MKILALIPARGGSKGIPRKNLIELGDLPLIAWTIAAARAAQSIDRVIVSTNDMEIAAVARANGAEVPFLRPDELADDTSSALAVIQHALEFLVNIEGWRPDSIAYLQPTSPFRRAETLETSISLLEDRAADTVVSVMAVPHNMLPDSLMRITNDELEFIIQKDNPIFRRQDKQTDLYARNGPAILLNRTNVIEADNLYGQKIAAIKMSKIESIDIDEQIDIEMARQFLPLIQEQS